MVLDDNLSINRKVLFIVPVERIYKVPTDGILSVFPVVNLVVKEVVQGMDYRISVIIEVVDYLIVKTKKD